MTFPTELPIEWYLVRREFSVPREKSYSDFSKQERIARRLEHRARRDGPVAAVHSLKSLPTVDEALSAIEWFAIREGQTPSRPALSTLRRAILERGVELARQNKRASSFFTMNGLWWPMIDPYAAQVAGERYRSLLVAMTNNFQQSI